MTLEQRRTRLIKRLECIYGEVQQIIVNDHLFWELQKIVKENDGFRNASGLFTRWIGNNYAQCAMIGLRRQVKLSQDSIALRGLLEEIKAYPGLVSRQHYMSLYRGLHRYHVQLGERDFDNVAGVGKDHIPIALIEQQIADICASAKKIEKYADRRVAHYDRRQPARPFPTLNDLTAAIKVQEKVVIFYWRLLKGANVSEMLPAIIFDWQDVFRFAWKP